MIKHCIIVKWNESVGDKESLIPDIKSIFDRTLEIDGVARTELIKNVTNRPNRYDLMIAITMEPSSLAAYDESEPHKEWKQKYGGLIASKAIFDFDV